MGLAVVFEVVMNSTFFPGVDIASVSKRFQKKRENITFYKRAIRGIQALWLVLVVVQLALGLSVLVLAVGAILAIGCLFTYIYGRIKFISILETARSRSKSKVLRRGGSKTEMDAEERRIMRVLDLIRRTSSSVIIGLAIISAIVVSLVPVTLNWKEYGQPGLASAYPTLLNSLILGLVIADAAILYYCHEMFENAIHNKLGTSHDTGPTRNGTLVPSGKQTVQNETKEDDIL